MNLDPEDKTFWDESAVETELKRVSDICNGCRRCFNLCPSFNDLFARLDRQEVDGDAEKLTQADLKNVTDLCYQCKLCFNHCPYTPPHRWEVDFPRLMLRAKAVQTQRDGQPFQDRFLGQVDVIGRLGNLFAPLINWLNRNSLQSPPHGKGDRYPSRPDPSPIMLLKHFNNGLIGMRAREVPRPARRSCSSIPAA